MFYPGSANELSGMVHTMLEQTDAKPPAHKAKAIIVPHAGYVYSGPIAARAFRQLVPQRDEITRVVLLGPCHRVPLRGLATSSADYFETPLGRIPLDRSANEAIERLPQVTRYDLTHAQEHSLEVQLPFLQQVLSSFSLVPLVVGDADADDVAEVLEMLWGGEETLIVISSDLSHYHPYEEAMRLDRATCDAIEHLDENAIGYEQACGRNPVSGLLTAARHHGLRATTLDLRNSGDTAGDRDRVVGYGAWMFANDAEH
jgi:hypothetical protein